MGTWFVSRHTGAVEWARMQGIEVERWVAHLEPEDVALGDIVIGTLPVQLAAQVCARGGRYLNLSLNLPFASRGKELGADELLACGAKLEEYVITPGRKDPCRDASCQAPNRVPK